MFFDVFFIQILLLLAFSIYDLSLSDYLQSPHEGGNRDPRANSDFHRVDSGTPFPKIGVRLSIRTGISMGAHPVKANFD